MILMQLTQTKELKSEEKNTAIFVVMLYHIYLAIIKQNCRINILTTFFL